MKKSIKILAGLALASAMVFTACTYSNAEEKTEMVPDVTGIVFGETKMAFADCKVSDAYCISGAGFEHYMDEKNKDADTGKYKDIVNEEGQTVLSIKDGILELGAFAWDSFKIELKSKLDLSEANKITVGLYVKDYTPGDAFVFEIASADDAAVGVTSWTDSSYFKDLSANVKTYELDLTKFAALGANGKFGDEAVNLEKIKTIGIHPRGAKGQIYLKSIVIE